MNGYLIFSLDITQELILALGNLKKEAISTPLFCAF